MERKEGKSSALCDSPDSAGARCGETVRRDDVATERLGEKVYKSELKTQNAEGKGRVV